MLHRGRGLHVNGTVLEYWCRATAVLEPTQKQLTVAIVADGDRFNPVGDPKNKHTKLSSPLE